MIGVRILIKNCELITYITKVIVIFDNQSNKQMDSTPVR